MNKIISQITSFIEENLIIEIGLFFYGVGVFGGKLLILTVILNKIDFILNLFCSIKFIGFYKIAKKGTSLGIEHFDSPFTSPFNIFPDLKILPHFGECSCNVLFEDIKHRCIDIENRLSNFYDIVTADPFSNISTEILNGLRKRLDRLEQDIENFEQNFNINLSVSEEFDQYRNIILNTKKMLNEIELPDVTGLEIKYIFELVFSLNVFEIFFIIPIIVIFTVHGLFKNNQKCHRYLKHGESFFFNQNLINQVRNFKLFKSNLSELIKHTINGIKRKR